jgi:hypothetical protein
MKDSKVQELGINELALARELESLLQDLRQYNIVFTGAREAKPGKITIKLNAQRTRLCLLVPGTNEIEIDPENNVIIPPVNGEVNPIYNAVRTRLMNTRTELKREQYDEYIGAAEQLILRHLLDTKQIEDRFPFLLV